jgi:hypothetical protein
MAWRASPYDPERVKAHIMRRVVVEERGHTSPCWIWTGPVTHQGYGRTSVPGVGPRVRFHRASYEAHRGAIPDGLCLDHLCSVRACCNPDHLEPVTPMENTRRELLRNGKRMCCHGDADRSPSRNCRLCARERAKTPEYRAARAAYMRAWYARKKADGINPYKRASSRAVQGKSAIAHGAG